MRRTERYYDCILCDEEHEGTPAVEIDFDPDVRRHTGDLVWHDHSPVEWPRPQTEIGLCPEHARELANYINQQLR